MQKDEIQKRVADVKHWYHRIDLGHGIVTPGYSMSWGFDKLNLPDLRGRTVLDVGCWDGLFSFECERRGASRVLATDHATWNCANGMKGFLTAREILNSTVEYKDIDVLDISPDTVGTWDIVLFLGVLYHLKNPLLALEKLAQVTKSLLIVESHIIVLPFRDDVPLMAFYETDELNRDASNWWGPNVVCLLRMLRSAGFELAELQATTVNDNNEGGLKKKARGLVRHIRRSIFGPGNEFYAAPNCRAIAHGWKQKEMKEAFRRSDSHQTR